MKEINKDITEKKDSDAHSVTPSPVLPLTPSSSRPGTPSLFTGISSSAVIIGFVSLLSDISGEMIYPILPMFLRDTLHAPATVVGLIEGIAIGVSNAVGGVSGWISDRIGRRKPVAFAGYVLTAVVRPVMAAAQVWPVVLGARFVERFGKGIRNAPRDALLAESTEAEYRGRAFGFERAMDSAGAVLGPLAALALVGWAGLGPRSIFLLSGIPAMLAALLILTVRERPEQVVAGSKKLSLSLAGTTREYKRLILIVSVFGIANSANALLILRAEDLGLAKQWTILAYALYNLVSTIAAMPAGAASDKFGRRNLLIIGYGVYALSYLGFAAADSAWMVWPLFALYGLFPAMTEGVAKAMAVDTAGRAGRATAIGIFATVNGVTQIAASYIGGVLYDEVSPQATFYFGAVFAALSVALLFLLLPSRIGAERV